MPNRRERRRAGSPRDARPAFDVEWKKATDFAEIAEALEIETDRIMAANLEPTGRVLVLYAPGDDELLYSATLRRGVDSIYFVESAPEPRPGMWEAIVAEMEREP